MRESLNAAVLAAALAMAGASAVAQESAAPVQSATAPAAAAAPALPACCLIPAGTPVVLELLEELASDTSLRGQKFRVRLAEPIVVGGRVLVPEGVRGGGEVIDVAKAGMGGRPGELIVAARYLTIGGVEVPVRAFKLGGHGENNSKDAQTVTLLVGIPGLFIRGGDIVMPIGARGPAKIGRDVTVAPPEAAQAAPEPTPVPAQEGKPTP